MKRFLLYIKFYLEPNGKKLRSEAFQAAKDYYTVRPLRTAAHPHPHPAEYSQRREAFLAFQQAYMNQYRHDYAKSKLKTIN
jgi:hypothetical protein